MQKNKIIIISMLAFAAVLVIGIFILKIPPEIFTGNVVYTENFRPDWGSRPSIINRHGRGLENSSYMILDNNQEKISVSEIENIFRLEIIGEKYVKIFVKNVDRKNGGFYLYGVYYDNGDELLRPIKGLGVNISKENSYFAIFSDKKQSTFYANLLDETIDSGNRTYKLDNGQAYEIKQLRGVETKFYSNNLGDWYVLTSGGTLYKYVDENLLPVEGVKNVKKLYSNNEGGWVALETDFYYYAAHSIEDTGAKLITDGNYSSGLKFMSDENGRWFMVIGRDLIWDIYYYVDGDKLWRVFNVVEAEECRKEYGCYVL